MKLVVVGGVAGGMSAAARARRLDENAQIVVFEAGPYVSFANCGLPYYVGGEIADEAKLLVQTPQSLRNALDLDVRVGHSVSAVDPVAKTVTVSRDGEEFTESYDRLILSPGAMALRPPLPGLDSPRVHTLRTVDDAKTMQEVVTDRQNGRAVVLGAGFIGIETAEALAHRGWDVALVELAPHVLPPLEIEMANPIADELRRLGIRVFEGVGASEVRQGSNQDTVLLSDGTELPADLIVLSVGVRPDTSPFERAGIACENGAIVVDQHGRTNVPDIWAAGDATLSVDAVTGARRPVALAGPANRAGRQIADNIYNPQGARPIPQPLGTAIVRVGELTAAMTGANRRSLDAAQIAYRTLHLHPNQHAGYFPGATAIALIVHFDADSGLLLGAQAVGREGVDKRIDVLATALRAGMTVEDLVDLDLAYAPPYGMAKDPVNLAGMMGENLLQGNLHLWYVEDIAAAESEALIIDVRRPDEFSTGRLPAAVNIPHTQIRDRIGEIRELADGRPVRLICHSGFRSYLGYRILAQEGFDAATFSGGMLTLRATLGLNIDTTLTKE